VLIFPQRDQAEADPIEYGCPKEAIQAGGPREIWEAEIGTLHGD